MFANVTHPVEFVEYNKMFKVLVEQKKKCFFFLYKNIRLIHKMDNTILAVLQRSQSSIANFWWSLVLDKVTAIVLIDANTGE